MKLLRSFRPLFITAALCVLALFFCSNEFARGFSTRDLLKVGEVAPSLSLKGFSDFPKEFPKPGSWNVVFFWSIFCQTCIEEMPILCEELNTKLSASVEGFFICLDSVKLKGGVENFLKKRSLSCQVLFDELASATFKAADSWGVSMTPTTFLVDPQGRIVFSKQGPFEIDELFTLLKQVTASESKPLTCASQALTVEP